MIAASVAGAWLGAGVVSGWPRRTIQIGMGVLLLGAAGIMVARLTGLVPAGGDGARAHRARVWRSPSPSTSCWARS